jgi:hypothetical protein
MHAVHTFRDDQGSTTTAATRTNRGRPVEHPVNFTHTLTTDAVHLAAFRCMPRAAPSYPLHCHHLFTCHCCYGFRSPFRGEKVQRLATHKALLPGFTARRI